MVVTDELRLFLNKYKVESGVPYTHTSLKGGKYNIPEEDINEFYQKYTRAKIDGISLHMTEKPMNPSPMRADLDFRFALPPVSPGAPGTSSLALPRLYDKTHIERILEHYFQILIEYIDESETKPPAHGTPWIVYVQEKTVPRKDRDKIKDGIHLIWPYLVIPHGLQHLIRKRILDVPDLFQGLKLCNKFEDVVDKAIIDKNPWMLYGSKKIDNEPYKITHIYSYSRDGAGLVELPPMELEEEIRMVAFLSMRHKTPIYMSMRDEVVREIEDFERLILPAIDERRKSKLHMQIFTKTRNTKQNSASQDDLVLTRQLVEECLNSRRAESYEDWIKLGWTLRNIDYRLLDVWTKFSKHSSKYIDGECQIKWDTMKIDTLGMGTLRWWAREDNPQKYTEIIDKNINSLIDKCIGSDGAHYDVARVVYSMFKDRYRFTVNDIWYHFKPEAHRWVRSKEGLKLKIVLSEEVCSKFLDRAQYYNREASRVGPEDANREIFEQKSKKLIQISLQLKKNGYKSSVMNECKSLFCDEKFEELLDSHPHLINFDNGVYDLRMHEFRDGLPDDYISFQTKRCYLPDLTMAHPDVVEIQKYLSQVFTSPAVCNYMKDILACIIDGSIKQEKFYVFTGSGSNSKSMLMSFFQKALGDYFCILPISLLTQKRAASNSAQSELERTRGRRCAVMQEPGDNEKINIGLMKELSGGDIIQCRGLYKEPIEFRPQFKMIMTCNELPEVPSDDGGTWRRIRVIEFTSKFVENPDPNNPREFPMDPELGEKMESWLNALIWLIIEHHRKVDPKRIDEPLEVRISTESYKKNNDSIGQYYNEKIEPKPGCEERIKVNGLYMDFKSWAYQIMPKGKKIPDRGQFRVYLEKMMGAYPSDGKGWKGYRLKGTEGLNDSDSD